MALGADCAGAGNVSNNTRKKEPAMMKGFGHTAIWVKDMEKSLHFYLDILGCKRAFSMPVDGEPNTGTEYIAVANGAFIELFYGGIPHEKEKAPEGKFYTGRGV